MQGSRCRVHGPGCRVQGPGFRVDRVQGPGSRVQRDVEGAVHGWQVRRWGHHGLGFRAQGPGSSVQGSGSRVQGPGSRAALKGLYMVGKSEGKVIMA